MHLLYLNDHSIVNFSKIKGIYPIAVSGLEKKTKAAEHPKLPSPGSCEGGCDGAAGPAVVAVLYWSRQRSCHSPAVLVLRPENFSVYKKTDNILEL